MLRLTLNNLKKSSFSKYPIFTNINTQLNTKYNYGDDLSQPIPDIPESNYKETVPEIKQAKLDNGIKIITINNQSPLVGVGTFINAGSAYETHENHGSFHFLKNLALSGTKSASGLRLQRLIENISPNFQVFNGRAEMHFKGEVFLEDMPIMVSALGDILRPEIQEWSLRDSRQYVSAETKLRSADPYRNLHSLMHDTAYRSTGMGRNPQCPEYNINRINNEDLLETVRNFYVGNRIVVVGTGIQDHEHFVEVVNDSFKHIEQDSIETPVMQPSNYVGGLRTEAGPSGTQVAVGYATEGSFTPEGVVLAGHLGIDMGGKRRPGNACTSHLRRNVVDKYDFVNSSSAYLANHQQLNFIGVKGVTSQNGNGPQLLQALQGSLDEIANNGLTQEELNTAINTSRRVITSFVSNRMVTLTSLGSAGLANSNDSLANLLSNVSKVSSSDVQKLTKDLLALNPTIVATGDVSGI